MSDTRRVPPLPAKVQPRKTFRTKVEPWMMGVVEEAILKGIPIGLIHGFLRVSKNTFHAWRVEGSKPECTDPLLVELAVTVEEARAQAAEKGVELMSLHALKDWKANFALLQAQDPEVWSVQSKQKVDVEVKQAPALNLSALSEEEFAQYELLAEKMKALPA